MKSILFFIVLGLTSVTFASEVECEKRTQYLAQDFFNTAAMSTDQVASNVEPREVLSPEENTYEYFGYIFSTEYTIIVKTDSECSPKSLQLIEVK